MPRHCARTESLSATMRKAFGQKSPGGTPGHRHSQSIKSRRPGVPLPSLRLRGACEANVSRTNSGRKDRESDEARDHSSCTVWLGCRSGRAQGAARQCRPNRSHAYSYWPSLDGAFPSPGRGCRRDSASPRRSRLLPRSHSSVRKSGTPDFRGRGVLMRSGGGHGAPAGRRRSPRAARWRRWRGSGSRAGRRRAGPRRRDGRGWRGSS
jgi:hypothetical protein